MSKSSTMCHYRTYAVNERLLLLNDLVCAREESGRYGETQRFRGLEVNDEPVFVRFHYRQIARLLAAENSGGVDTGLPPDVGRVGAVADQATLGDEVGPLVHDRHRLACREGDEPLAVHKKIGTRLHERAGPLSHQR